MVEASEPLDFLHSLIYRQLIKHIDAHDTGIAHARFCFKDRSTFVFEVAKLSNSVLSEAAQLSLFLSTLSYAQDTFTSIASHALSSHYPAFLLVKSCLQSSQSIDPSGRILVIPTPCPWQPVFRLVSSTATYCVFPVPPRWGVQRLFPCKAASSPRYSLGAALPGVVQLQLDCSYGETDSQLAAVALARCLLEGE